MTTRNRITTVLTLAAVAIAILVLPAAAKEIPAQLPDPDSTPPDLTKPVKVYILMGQSNMVGFGRINPDTTKGTLAYLTNKEGKYPHLLDNEGNWTKRNDVWYVQVTVGQRQHWLQPADKHKHIGPELQFGHVMGYYHDEMVLVIKASQGNRSLGWDILPPESKRFTFNGRTYAGYKDTPSSWIEGQPKKPVNWYAGKQYDDFVRDTHKVLGVCPSNS